ncbi:hypothetical protein D3C80_1916960 [compost metagenome]
MRPEIILLKHHADVLTQIANRFIRRGFGEIEMIPGDFKLAGTWHFKQIEDAQQ